MKSIKGHWTLAILAVFTLAMMSYDECLLKFRDEPRHVALALAAAAAGAAR